MNNNRIIGQCPHGKSIGECCDQCFSLDEKKFMKQLKMNKPETITAAEFLKTKGKKKPRQVERDLQIACINYFRAKYPQYYMNCFAVGNGGSRNIIEGANLKRSGVLAGVSDVIILVPNKTFHGLCIEFKKDYKAKQTPSQISFEVAVQMQGYKYAVVCSFDSFLKLITDYLK